MYGKEYTGTGVYRLYSLGYLSLGIPEAPGNQGLLDQLEALKFVQAAITHFGGDPNQVTLMGQSAGSSSAMYHLMSPRSAGLFQQVIAQSGSNFSPSLHSITGSQATRYLMAPKYNCEIQYYRYTENTIIHILIYEIFIDLELKHVLLWDVLLVEILLMLD